MLTTDIINEILKIVQNLDKDDAFLYAELYIKAMIKAGCGYDLGWILWNLKKVDARFEELYNKNTE